MRKERLLEEGWGREEESKDRKKSNWDQLGSSDGAGQEVEQWQSEDRRGSV